MSARYNQVLHDSIETSYTEGEELHVLSQDARGTRVLNLRICTVAPTKSGYTGYTKRGFYLTRKETLALRDALSDLLKDPTFVDETEDTMKEVPETLGGDS